jgi:hypothetical protein
MLPVPPRAKEHSRTQTSRPEPQNGRGESQREFATRQPLFAESVEDGQLPAHDAAPKVDKAPVEGKAGAGDTFKTEKGECARDNCPIVAGTRRCAVRLSWRVPCHDDFGTSDCGQLIDHASTPGRHPKASVVRDTGSHSAPTPLAFYCITYPE